VRQGRRSPALHERGARGRSGQSGAAVREPRASVGGGPHVAWDGIGREEKKLRDREDVQI
jgi:hypothetical protein